MVDYSWLLSAPCRVALGSGATEQAVVDAEAVVGPFPPSYRDFLLQHGSGDIGGDDVYALNGEPVLSVVRNTVWERTMPGRLLPPDMIAVSNDGGGNIVCMRRADIPGADEAVYVWWHDDDSEEPERYADSFDDWLHSRVDLAVEFDSRSPDA